MNVTEALQGEYLGSAGPSFDTARRYFWNIPAWFDATVFAGVDAILETASTASEWWVQRHAIEVIGLLFVYDRPWHWNGGDANNPVAFDRLRDEMRQRRDEVLSFLQTFHDEPDLDPDVLRSVVLAERRVLSFYAGDIARYIPMTVGNYWELSGSPREEIIASALIGGKTYYHFGRLREYSNIYARMSADNKLFVRTAFGEAVWLDLTGPLGGLWTVPAFDDSSALAWVVYLRRRTPGTLERRRLPRPAGSGGSLFFPAGGRWFCAGAEGRSCEVRPRKPTNENYGRWPSCGWPLSTRHWPLPSLHNFLRHLSRSDWKACA